VLTATASRVATCAGGRGPGCERTKLWRLGADTGASRTIAALATARLGTLTLERCTSWAETNVSRGTTVTAVGTERLTYRMLVTFVTFVTCAMFTFCT